VVSPWVKAEAVFGADPSGKIFDHTSILKTIARRFLSNNPPYMGARYAAAADLSTVLGTSLRQPQFLPFIRYRLQFAQSQLMLDVEGANPARGVSLWQFAANGTVAQDFSFEDAGDGWVYLRSHVSNLYVTAGAYGPIVNSSGSIQATAGQPPASKAAPAGPGVFQDLKYAAPRTTLTTLSPRPEQQKWRFAQAGIAVMDRELFVVSNEAYPGLVLQPANLMQPESVSILGPPPASSGLLHPAYAWKVTSPLILDQIVSRASRP
jgi:hypothetical protein